MLDHDPQAILLLSAANVYDSQFASASTSTTQIYNTELGGSDF